MACVSTWTSIISSGKDRKEESDRSTSRPLVDTVEVPQKDFDLRGVIERIQRNAFHDISGGFE